MGAEAVTAGSGPRIAPAATAERLGPLTHRASLNAGAALLDYGARVGTALVVTPIMVSGLGRTLFGVWEMLYRLAGYLQATDGRPTEALRLVIAQHQADDDDELKRRFVGAALAVWILLLPLLVAAGALLVWLAPAMTGVPPEVAGEVRLTVGLLVLTLMLTSLASVPESALRGMNLGYRRMGWQAGLHVLGGALMAAAILTGLGLAGLAGTEAVRALATGLCFLLLVRTYIAWFGAARPALAEIRTLFGMSLWLAAGDVIAKLLLASDVIILGVVLAPALVTTYVLTGYAARIAVGLHAFAAGAAMPGVGGLLGSGESDRAARARSELLLLTWFFVTAVGATILLWNRSFISLWVGAENYTGPWVNLLIVLIAVQTAFIRVDAYLIDAALQPRRRVLVSALAALATISLAIPLTWAFGLVGLCAGLLAGRAVQSIAYPILARKTMRHRPASGLPAAPARLLAVTALFFASALTAGERFAVASWPAWIAGVPFTVAAFAAFALLLGPGPDDRRRLTRRLGSLIRLGRNG